MPEQTRLCEACNQTIEEDDDCITTTNGNTFHEECGTARNDVYCCSACSEYVDTQADTFFFNSMECESCYWETRLECESCGGIIFRDESEYDEDSDSTLCHSCYEDCLREREEERVSSALRFPLNNYSYKPRAVFHETKNQVKQGLIRKARHDEICHAIMQSTGCIFHPDISRENERYNRMKCSRRFYGLEVETECPFSHDPGTILDESPLDDSLWYAKHDGSIGSQECAGYELVSHPFSWDYLQENQESMITIPFRYLRSRGFRSHNSGRCGIHIHVSKYSVSRMQVWRSLLFFRSHEDFILQVSQREQQQLDCYSRIEKNKRNMMYMAKNRCASDSRYTAINLCPSATVEFRIFRGNIRPERILKNIEFIHSLLAFTMDEKYSNADIRYYLDYVHDRKKEYSNLHSFLNEIGFTNGMENGIIIPMEQES